MLQKTLNNVSIQINSLASNFIGTKVMLSHPYNAMNTGAL